MSSQKFALIVGNGEYEDRKFVILRSPEKDARDLARTLNDQNIGAFDHVDLLVNESETVIRRAIVRFFSNKNPDDLILLYFSCHGVRDIDTGRLYLASKDTDPTLLDATSIPANLVTEQMDKCRSKRQILILDCCHSGAFAYGSKSQIGSSVGIGTTFEGTGYGRVVLTASDATQFAWEGDKVIGETEKSLFTHYLVQGLETGEADADADGFISLDELYNYAFQQVKNQTTKQTPCKWGYKEQGNIILAKNPKPIVPELSLEIKQALDSPFPGTREGALRDMSRLLHGNNRYLIQLTIETLKRVGENDDSLRVRRLANELLASYQEDKESGRVQVLQELPKQPATIKVDGIVKERSGEIVAAPPKTKPVWASTFLTTLGWLISSLLSIILIVIISLIWSSVRNAFSITSPSLAYDIVSIINNSCGGLVFGFTVGLTNAILLRRAMAIAEQEEILAIALGWALALALGAGATTILFLLLKG